MTDRTPRTRGHDRTRLLALSGLLLLQGGCAIFFVGDVALDMLGWHGAESRSHLGIEALASVVLVLSLVFTGIELHRMRLRQRRLEQELRAASGAFLEVMEAEFRAWGLTPSERDVALLSVKGLSIAEIAAARRTRPGTVKAQLNAVYAKAGVGGRHELLSRFIEDLMGEVRAPAA